MRACLNQERDAQKEFYDRFSPFLRGICLRYASCGSEADDLLQETFIRAFKFLDQYDGRGELGAWLRRISIHACLENYRKNKRLRVHLAQFSLQQEQEEFLDHALHEMNLNDLLHKIQRLPLGFRTVFNLYAIEGYNHGEIAKALSISEGTSKSQYSRARWLLRKMIEEESQVELNRLKYARE